MSKKKESVIQEKIGSLSFPGILLFATSCAERLYQTVKMQRDTIQERGKSIRKLLDSLWSEAEANGEGITIQGCDFYEQYIPDENEKKPLNPIVESSVMAAIYACMCLQDRRAQNAVWAAHCEWEVGTEFAIVIDGVDHSNIEEINRSIYMDFVYKCQLDTLNIIADCKDHASLLISKIRKHAQSSSVRIKHWAEIYEEKLSL